MAIAHDLHDAPDKTPDDPAAKIDKAADAALEWEKKSAAARAKREFEDEERQAKQAREREQNPPKTPFEVKGSINLGNFDFQKQQDELKSTIDSIQVSAQTEITKLREDNDNQRDRIAEVRFAAISDSMKAQIDALQTALNQSLTRKEEKGLVAQISEVTQIAGALGLSKPDASAGDTPSLRLAMLKMQLEGKAADKKWELDKIQSERTWQLSLKRLEAEGAQAAASIQAEREKRERFASPFEALGTAIARGLIDSGGSGESARPEKKITRRKKSQQHLEAGENDSGEVECPDCRQPVAIPPKVTSTICPSCDATISIDRTADGPR